MAVLTGAVISLVSLSGCDGAYYEHGSPGPRVYITPSRPSPPPRFVPYRGAPHPGPGYHQP